MASSSAVVVLTTKTGASGVSPSVSSDVIVPVTPALTACFDPPTLGIALAKGILAIKFCNFCSTKIFSVVRTSFRQKWHSSKEHLQINECSPLSGLHPFIDNSSKRRKHWPEKCREDGKWITSCTNQLGELSSRKTVNCCPRPDDSTNYLFPFTAIFSC